MQKFNYYYHQDDGYIYLSEALSTDVDAEFIWLSFERHELIQNTETWQRYIFENTGILLNEFHLKDIQNLEHPCVFDALDDYDLLIFKKLITPDDYIQIQNGHSAEQQTADIVTTPVSFVMTSNVLITVHERGNRVFETYLERVQAIQTRPIEQQNIPRKLAQSPVDIVLRLLNMMVDGYLGLRAPLTKRVEFWQKELLQGNQKFNRWNQLLQEITAFQQVENLCEEQVECLQELRDEIVENYHHIKAKRKAEKQNLMLVRMNDLISHIERIQKHSVRLNHAVQAAIDLHFSAVANQTNENMRILAIITAVFAPLTLLTGIYGMNFEFIPGLNSPHGFWYMLTAMCVTTLLLIWYFYRRQMVGRGEKSVMELLAQQNQQQQLGLFAFLEYEPIQKTLKGTLREMGRWTRLK